MINELVVKSEEREMLWKNLRERGLNPGMYGQKHESDASTFDLSLLEFLNSFIDLENGEDGPFEI